MKSQKTEGGGIPSLKKDGQLIIDTVGKAEMLNEQYKSVFTTELDGPVPDKGPSPHLTMEDPIIMVNGAEKILKNIKANKAAGPDAVTARVMKETAT